MKDVKLYGHSVYFTAVWYILWSFGILCSHFGLYFFPLWYVGIFYGHLVYFVAILAYFSRFGMLYREKTGSLLRPIWLSVHTYSEVTWLNKFAHMPI
jgi:hypothetical protein